MAPSIHRWPKPCAAAAEVTNRAAMTALDATPHRMPVAPHVAGAPSPRLPRGIATCCSITMVVGVLDRMCEAADRCATDLGRPKPRPADNAHDRVERAVVR